MAKFILFALIFIVICLWLGKSPSRTLGRVFGRFMGGVKEGLDSTPKAPPERTNEVPVKGKERNL